MPTAKALSFHRLLQIEEEARSTRRQAKEQLTLLGHEMDRNADIQTLALAASVLTEAIVQARPNLEQDGERLAGVLRHEDDVLHLLYEEYDPPVRQRFSVAHELGHAVLHSPEGQPLSLCCASRYVQPEDLADEDESDVNGFEDEVPDREAEADAFAAAFLLPQDELRADVGHFGRCAVFLAGRYAVSEATMKRRLRDLDSLSRDTLPVLSEVNNIIKP